MRCVAFGAELPIVFPLAVELAALGDATAIHLSASARLFWRRTAWSFNDADSRLTKETWTYPPGFNRRFAPLFDGAIRARCRRLIARARRATGEQPYVITPHPHFFKYLVDVNPDKLIYLNYDATALDEEAVVAHAGTILCSSHYQATRFAQRFRQKADAIFHFPHGVHESFLNPRPLDPAEPDTVCSVGYLSARTDWRLVHTVAEALRDVTFSFVGDIDSGRNPGQRPDWRRWLDAVLQLPNVVHRPGLKHRETAPHYWRSAVNWMPYNVDLPFVDASCPLKLTDGLASGRPIVSAEVPESRLYPEWVGVYRDAAEAVSLIRSALDSRDASRLVERTQSQLAFARQNTWAVRARRLLTIVNEPRVRREKAAVC